MSHKIIRRFHGCDYAMCGGLVEVARRGLKFVTVMLAERRPRVEV